MASTIRSFLAIEIDTNLIDTIESIQNEFKKIDGDMKYVSLENMHFTLKFFGNIDESQVSEISESIEYVLKDFEPFDLYIKGTGSFPNENIIKVLWIGIENNPTLTKLQKQLDKSFSKIGFKKEKNFKSHLTLARVKSKRNKQDIQNKIAKFKNSEIGTMTVKKIALKKSTLTSNGPIYDDLKIFNL